MKRLSSQPDAAKFRSIVAVIFILLCVGVFLYLTDDLSEKAEIIAIEKVLVDIEYSLAMLVYDYVIKGKQKELANFDKQNPVIPLAIYRSIPQNYKGEIVSVKSGLSNGWYFERDTKNLVYLRYDIVLRRYELSYQRGADSTVGRLIINITQ